MPKSTVSKTRNWWAILYVESAEPDWIEIIKEMHIPCIVSPYHDQDFNKDGTPKKPHYHVCFFYDGPKTYKNAKEDFDRIGAVMVEDMKSVYSCCRYLIHLDDPDKPLYDHNDIRCFNGIAWDPLIENKDDDQEILSEIQQFIIDNDIKSFSYLADYSHKFNKRWFKIITRNYSYYLDKYIKSKYWADKNL